jgi:hypothetical protein
MAVKPDRRLIPFRARFDRETHRPDEDTEEILLAKQELM